MCPVPVMSLRLTAPALALEKAGRTLLFKSRKGKQWKTVAKHQQWLPRERRRPRRRSRIMSRSMCHRTRCLQLMAGSTLPEAVSHGKKVYTPCSKLDKKKLSARTREFLEQNAGKGNIAREYKEHFTLAGGNQACEPAEKFRNLRRR